MTASDFTDLLELPPNAFVDKRVPKKLLLENGAPTAADKRAIQDGLDEIRWVASLKPSTVGVAAFQGSERTYPEIAVIQLVLREGAKENRLVELVHRAIPYPVVLVTEAGSTVSVSLVEKRDALNEAERVVLDGDLVTSQLGGDIPDVILSSFIESLPLAKQPLESMRTLYTGWMDALVALKTSSLTGTFSLPQTSEHALLRRRTLKDIARLDSEIAAVRRAASAEKQMARRVELNLEHSRLRDARASALKNL